MVELLKLIFSAAILMAQWVRSLLGSDDPEEGFLAWLTRLRLILGCVALFVVNLQWKWQHVEAWEGAGEALVQFTFKTPVYVSGSLVVGCSLVLALTRRGSRRKVAKALVPPLLRMAGTFGALCVAIALAYVALQVGVWAGGRVPKSPTLTLTIIFVLLFVLALMIVFAVAILLLVAVLPAAYFISRDLFGARDAHPHLRAIVVILLSLWTAFAASREVASQGLDGMYPAAIGVTILIGGPLSTIGCGVAEIVWVTRVQGARLRGPVTSALAANS